MTLFPQFSDSFYVEDDKDILKLMEYTYSKNITINQSFWLEADIDARFKAGDQSVMSELYGSMPGFNRRQFTFNRIRRVVNMVCGYQRQHRKSTVVTPIEERGQKTADQFTKLMYHINNRGSVYETLSEAYEGAITSGMNLIGIWNDFRTDPVSGDIAISNLSYNGYLIDPFFQSMDLSDCNNIWTRRYLSKSQVSMLLPDRKEELRGVANLDTRDGKFQFQPESYNYANQNLMTYDEFWYLSSRKQLLLVDVETGETTEWRGQDEDLAEFMKMYPNVVTLNQEIPTTKLAIVVQGKVMYHGPNPLGIDRYPFAPVWAYYEPHLSQPFSLRVQGVVRGLRDAQYLFNHRRRVELDILESQVNSGWIYKENALVNPKDVFMSGQGRGLAIKAEAQITDVQKIMPSDIPPSMIQLSELLGQEISQISGVNEELLGSAEDDKAGILSMLRQGAGLTTLQTLFDNLDRAQKLIGNIQIEIIQANWTPGKIQRIIGEEPSPEFYNRAFGKYDAIVEEAPLTSTQKQMALRQAFYLKELGIPIPTSYLIENMNIPDKDKLMEQIAQAEQAQAQQQQRMEALQMQQMQVDAETKLSYSEAQHSLAYERINKTKLDAALSEERKQRAEEDRTGAVLNLIKAAKEIQEMDLGNIERALGIVHQVSGAEEIHNKQHEIQQHLEQKAQEHQQQQEMLQQQAQQQQRQQSQQQQNTQPQPQQPQM
jgi:hypothetical protein